MTNLDSISKSRDITCALWAMQTSNWCEQRISQGINVDEFALTCYRNAKAFCREFEENRKP